jgi:hypothetical protein
MTQCKKCKLFLSATKDDIVKCKGPCESVYHKKCAPKAFMKTEMCEPCSKKEGSPAGKAAPKITIDVNKATAETLLEEVNKKLAIIYEQGNGLREKIDNLTENVDFYAEQYQIMTEFKKSAENKIAALERKNIHLQKINESLEERITQIELKEVENEVELVGAEQTKNENTINLIAKIAEKLELDVSEIETVKRVGRERPDEKRPRPIVIKLRSKTARSGWLKHKKTRLTNADILKNDNDKRIFINENLTRQQRSLFWNTKTSLKGTYKYIWVQDLRILVKKTDTSKIYNIKTEADISRLLCANNEVTVSK